MQTHNYDREKAERLVPLLRSITREIRERSEVIERLDRAIGGARGDARAGHAARWELRLVEHRRSLRDAERELEELGCTLDEDHPLRILIPGSNGAFERGFAFDGSSGEPRAIAASGGRCTEWTTPRARASEWSAGPCSFPRSARGGSAIATELDAQRVHE
ncbi:MAG: DUF2203 family protein, partial [Planctomycetes bacterium]|nr:DUF2203 family protein [Planctomycetota bacterium]